MNEEQRAAAERLAAYHAEQADHFSPFGSGNALTIFHGEAAALLRELLAEPQGEPVATLLEQSRQNCLRNFGPNGLADWIYNDLVELLADAAPQQQRPLTDEQIDKLLDAERMKWTARTGPPTHEFAAAFARAIEKAHGIVEEA